MKPHYLIACTLLAAVAYSLWPTTSAATDPSTAQALRPEAEGRSRWAAPGAPAAEAMDSWQRYALDFRAAATFDPDTPDARTIDLSVQGLWKATQAGTGVYEIHLENAKIELEGAEGNTEAIEHALEVAHYVRLDEHGAISDVLTAADTDPATWRIWFAIASYMQFSDGEGEQWTASELDPAGEYVAEYSRRSADEYEKRKLQYSRVRADGGWLPQEKLNLGIDGLVRVTRRGPGLPQRVAGGETSWTEASTSFITLSVRTDVSLDLVDAGTDADAERRFAEREGALMGGLLAPSVDNEQTRPARGFAELLETLGSGEGPPSFLIEEMGLAIRRDPSAAASALAFLRADEGADEGHVLVAALSAAGTPEAQEALRALAQDTKISELLATEAIVEIGRTAAPDEASVALLVATLDDTRDTYASTAALALGNVVDQLGARSERAQAALDRLVAKLAASRDLRETVDLLAALGNTASAQALEYVQPYLTAEDEELRAAAADAIKLLPSTEVPALLAARLADDPSIQVRARAAYALGHCTGLVAFESLASSLHRESDAGVRGEALASAARVGGQSSKSIELLQWVAQNDASEELRAQATQLL